MKQLTVFLVFAIVATLGLAANEAIVTEVSGLVQYRTDATSGWNNAEVGTRLSQNATVVTGLNGTASLSVGLSSVSVTPLSRVQVSELFQAPTTERVQLTVPYGRVTANVRRAQNRGTDFRVLTPVATAAVRGTEFTFDGTVLRVSHGDVALGTLANQAHSVREGQESWAYRYQPIGSVEKVLEYQRYF